MNEIDKFTEDKIKMITTDHLNTVVMGPNDFGVIFSDDVKKQFGLKNPEDYVKLNRSQLRELCKSFPKRLKSDKMLIFDRNNREEIKEIIEDTWKATRVKRSNFQGVAYMDLSITENEDGEIENDISVAFKHFDNPNVELEDTDNNFYFVRPLEQTKAERQTQQYQLELLLDILVGSVKPSVTFVVLLDKGYANKIFIYDGQHKLLTGFDFIFSGKKYSIESLKGALAEKVKFFGSIEHRDCWKLFNEFADGFDGEEFDIKDLFKSVPEIKPFFEDKDTVGVVGNLHFCDSRSASLLFKKLNENFSSHSTMQRVKAELTHTKFHEILFGTHFEINDKLSGYLSDIIPSFTIFNRTGKTIPNGLPTGFSYDTRSNDYNQMNYDQYLMLMYTLILSKVKLNFNGDGYIFDVKCKLLDSQMHNNAILKNDMWKSTTVYPKIQNYILERLTSLEIPDEEKFKEFLQNCLKISYCLGDDEYLTQINNFSTNLNDLKIPYKDARDVIKKKYGSGNITSEVDIVEDAEIGKKIGALEDFKLKQQYQLPMLMSLVLRSHKNSFSIENWFKGYLSTMNSAFDVTAGSDIEEIIMKRHRQTYTRMKTLQKFYDTGKFFTDKVTELLSSDDESLWTRMESLGFIKDYLDHSNIELYKCPHSCEYVTTDNYHSHHLSFRSVNPNKVFDYWFPLSSEFNIFISNNPKKNIVKNHKDGTSGNFLDACETMIRKMDERLKTATEPEDIRAWKKSILTLRSWMVMAEDNLTGETAEDNSEEK